MHDTESDWFAFHLPHLLADSAAHFCSHFLPEQHSQLLSKLASQRGPDLQPDHDSKRCPESRPNNVPCSQSRPNDDRSPDLRVFAVVEPFHVI